MKYRLIGGLTVFIVAAGICVGAGAFSARRVEAKEAVQSRETDAASRNEPVLQESGREEAERIETVNSQPTGDTVLMRGGGAEYLRGIDGWSFGGSADPLMTAANFPQTAPDQVFESGEEGSPEEEEAESEYEDLALANVAHYVNVRAEATTDSSVLGKIYNGAVAQILETVEGENGQWFRIVSGNVEGYIKSEYFLWGDAAADAIDEYVTRYANVVVSRLNVRENPGTDSKRIGYVVNGEKIQILENQGEWLQVQYTEEKTGFVAAEFVTISEEFVYAKTLEEEAAELAAKRALEERQHESETQVTEDTAITVTPPSGNYGSNSELRNEIVNYAMQFLGNRYVHGGQSLVSGTDCSGFTSLLYAEFGYSLSRTPSGQLSNAGRSISYEEIQPGDIICYGSGKRCTHVALYIGDGQIIHAANPRKGVVTGNATYGTILGVKNIID